MHCNINHYHTIQLGCWIWLANIHSTLGHLIKIGGYLYTKFLNSVIYAVSGVGGETRKSVLNSSKKLAIFNQKVHTHIKAISHVLWPNSAITVTINTAQKNHEKVKARQFNSNRLYVQINGMTTGIQKTKILLFVP